MFSQRWYGVPIRWMPPNDSRARPPKRARVSVDEQHGEPVVEQFEGGDDSRQAGASDHRVSCVDV
jgi:hypothetical protein